MNFTEVLINCIWSGLFAGGMGILLTTPFRYIIPAFLCGFSGRLSRDVLMSIGVNQNWSTVVASAIIVFVAVALVRKHEVPPVVLITGVLPLGAAVAMFNIITELMKVSSLKGEALRESSVLLSSNVGKTFTISLAIALGLGIGIAIIRLLRRQ